MAWHDLDGRIVVFDDNMRAYLTLNDSGATLWRRLAPGATYDELMDALLAEYGIDAHTAAEDIDRFLEELSDHKMVETSVS
jgi:Coenzyme PQQ synthesis protein D (PqqD)